MELKDKLDKLEKEINTKEKIIQIMSGYEEELYFLTNFGRIIKKYYHGHPDIAGGHWKYADITPNLTKID